MSAASHEVRLRQLLTTGALVRSQCSASLLALLEPLIRTHIIAEERAGGGRRLIVRDSATLAAFIAREYPHAPTPLGTLSRTLGIARFRDSKTFPSDTPELVHCRVTSDHAITRAGRPVPATSASAEHGIFSFLLHPDSPYSLHGPCALVENPAVFTSFEQLGLDVSLVLYGSGRASHRLITWLTAQADDFSLLHIPDYDPVGLQEYERLHAHLVDRVRLHLPDDLDTRFATFANRTLLNKERSRATLMQLRRSSLPEVQRVVTLIDQHNAGLEQEALLL